MPTPKPMMKSTGKVAPSKTKKTMPSKTSKSKMSSMGSENPIGPQTKRETKKTARVAKRADRKVLTPMTPVGIQAGKEKLKANRKKAAVAVGATVGTIGAGLYSMYLDKTKPGRNDRKAKKARGE